MIAALLFIACGQKAVLENLAPQDEQQYSRNILAMLRAGDFEAIEAKLDPSVRKPDDEAALRKMAAAFPAGEPTSTQIIGFRITSSIGRRQVDLTFQYTYPGKWVLAQVLLTEEHGVVQISGLHVQPLLDSLENINRFTLRGKTLAHYLVLVVAILLPVFMLYVLVLCIRTPIPKRKWLWVLFILMGFVQITFNWTDGAIRINPLALQVLGAGVGKSSNWAPWMITVSTPLGAAWFLRRRKRYLAQEDKDNDPEATEAEPSESDGGESAPAGEGQAGAASPACGDGGRVRRSDECSQKERASFLEPSAGPTADPSVGSG